MIEQTRHALVAGGSLAGLAAAVLLRRAGWRVSVFERVADDLADCDVGVAKRDALWDVLAEAGLDVAHRPGVRIRRRVVLAGDGSVVAERAVEEVVSSWDAIYRLLRGAFEADHHRGRAVERVRQDADTVTITLEGDREVTGHQLVAADGAGSAMRAQLLPDVESEDASYVAWRGLVEEGDMDPAARELRDAFSPYTPPGEQMPSYTIPGPRGEEEPGHRRHDFVWYQPAEPERVSPDLLTDADGETHGSNIAPTKIRPAVIEAMRDHACAVLSPAYAALARCVEHPFIQPIADHVSRRLVFGAALARPHVGAGTTRALEDAAALAAALATMSSRRCSPTRWRGFRRSARWSSMGAGSARTSTTPTDLAARTRRRKRCSAPWRAGRPPNPARRRRSADRSVARRRARGPPPR